MQGLVSWWRRPMILVALALIGIALVLFWPYLASRSTDDTSEAEVALLEPGDSQAEFLLSPEQNAPAVLPTTVVTPAAETASVVVYISGAVAQPDVYTLPAEARVKDLVMAAGGFTPEADSERINLASPVQDAEHIHVPRVGEQSDTAMPADVAGGGAAHTAGGLINLNTASQAELEELPGIGQSLAQRIIAYRTTNGPFTAVDDLQEVTGIGASLVADIRDQITVGN